MAGMEGLAYLMSLLGGASKGQYEGYSAGIGDQQKAADLAEKQRQFDEGQFTDINPAQAAATGIPAGRTRNTLIPAFLQANEKNTARAEQLKRGEAAAKTYEQAAPQFPEAMPRAGAMLEPEAAGTQPEQGPNRFLTTLAGLARAGVGKEDIQPFTEFMKQQSLTQRGGMGGRTQLVQDADGNWVAVPLPKAGPPGEPIPTGVQGMASHSADYNARRQMLISQGMNPNSPEFKQAMGDYMERVITVAPGGAAYRKGNIPSEGVALSQEGQPQPTGLAPTDFATFQRDMFRSGKTMDETEAAWGKLQGKAPAQVTIPGGKPGLGQPSISRPALTGTETTRNAAQASYAVKEMATLADEIDHMSPDTQNRISQAWRAEAQSIPFLNAIQFLTPQEQDVATRLRHAQIRYEAAVSGLRGAGSPQMYERFQKIIGPFTGATTPSSLRALSRSMADYLQELHDFEQSTGHTGFPGQVKPSPAPNPQIPSGAPTGGGEQWERGPDGKLRRVVPR